MLEQLAERLRECTRETDLVARQGGDEFLLLLSDLERGPAGSLPGTDAALLVAESVATRVNEALASRSTWTAPSSTRPPRSASACSRRTRRTPRRCFATPTAAMYQTKRNAPGGYVVFSATTRTPRRCCRSPPGCGGRSTSSTGCCTTSRSWTSATGMIGRRGAGPLARPERRTRAARGVHPARRGDGSDRGDRRLGDRGAHRAVRGPGSSGARPRGQLQPVAASAVVAEPVPSAILGKLQACEHGSREGRRGDHRVHRDGRSRAHPADARGAARLGSARWRSTTSAPGTRRSRA